MWVGTRFGSVLEHAYIQHKFSNPLCDKWTRISGSCIVVLCLKRRTDLGFEGYEKTAIRGILSRHAVERD